MIKIDEVIIVEGKYDKIKLSSLVDATVLEVNGFSVYKDKERVKLIRRLAEKKGIVILTDSDRAGFQLRTFLSGGIDEKKIKHAYIPDVIGKEKRKSAPSKEGTLGVEGISPEILLQSLRKAGVTAFQSEEKESRKITKTDLYEDGISGGKNSTENRKKLLFTLDLPSALSANRLIEVLNIFYSYEEYKEVLKSLFGNDNIK